MGDDRGLQYVKLRKAPDGYLGATRLVEYVDSEPYMRVQRPPGSDAGTPDSTEPSSTDDPGADR